MVRRQSCITKAYCRACFTGKVSRLLIDLRKPQKIFHCKRFVMYGMCAIYGMCAKYGMSYLCLYVGCPCVYAQIRVNLACEYQSDFL